ncbi:unnamed protein product [Gulo gulo]|uniref:Uncharacterized protein n=1 Tax=Gulo gulo TaxID=48420 RepID=A0A9X9LYR4_GULGU|nr:unnamed protein product [Gulo gulo]
MSWLLGTKHAGFSHLGAVIGWPPPLKAPRFLPIANTDVSAMAPADSPQVTSATPTGMTAATRPDPSRPQVCP